MVKKGIVVDCLKITEDKSSDNRVHTLDTRMIKAIDAVSRRGVRSPRLNITAVPKRGVRGPRLNIIAVPKCKARCLRFNAISVPKCEVQDTRPTSSQLLNVEFKLAF